MKLVKTVNKSDLHFDFVNILNGVLQLSKREAEVFSYILLADQNGHNNNINTKSIREDVMNKLGINDANLSRYLGTMKSKRLIIRGKDNKWVINDNIRPVIESGNIEITFILNIKEDEKNENTAINGTYYKEKKSSD